MFKKIAAGLPAVLLSVTLVSCSEAVSVVKPYEPDTSLPVYQQILDSGVFMPDYTYEDEDDQEQWELLATAICIYDETGEFETPDEFLLDEGLDQAWNEKERSIVIQIAQANKCPHKELN